jgi:hypothetical protein
MVVIPIMPTLGKLRLEEHKFEASVGYTVRPYLKKKKKRKRKRDIVFSIF